jgi:hypothetical protein
MKKYLFWALLPLAMLGCSESTVTVKKTVEAIGYVRPQAPGATHWLSFRQFANPLVDCAPTTNSLVTECFQAGIYLEFKLPSSYTSCAGLSGADALGIFIWNCASTADGLFMRTSGRMPGKGLREFIDFTTLQWKPNYVVVSGQGAVFNSKTSFWYSDPIIPLTSSSTPVPLDVQYGVYIAASDLNTTGGFSIQASQVSVVSSPTATITYLGTGSNNCNQTTGLTGSPDIKSAFCAGTGANFPYFEAYMVASGGANRGINLVTAHFPQFFNSYMNGGGVYLRGIGGAKSDSLFISNGNLSLNGSNGSYLAKLRISVGGVSITNGSSANSFDAGVISNSPTAGISVNESLYNVFNRYTVLNSGTDGISVTGTFPEFNVFSMVTVVGSGSRGINAPTPGRAQLFNSVLVANSGSDGVAFNGPTGFGQLAVFASNGYGVNFGGSGSPAYRGHYLTSGTSPGDCNGTPSPCTAGTITVIDNLASAGLFKGKVLVDDPINTSDTNGGYTSYPSNPYTFDWVRFANSTIYTFDFHKAWGLDGSSFPNANQRGAWLSPNNGRIWDLALTAASPVFNVVQRGNAANDPIVANTPCPDWVKETGSYNRSGTAVLYLTNAFEITELGGNGDGLCSAGEACIAAPNFGAYQGEGNALAYRCDYDANPSPTIPGVKMYFYPVNGR